MSETACIALGSNLGDRERYLSRAREAIASLPGTRIVAQSAVEQTEPIGPKQGPYLNQMIAVDTELSPYELLQQLHRIETENGRERGTRWGPRTLDLDIVNYGDSEVVSRELVIPHPELPHRDFWRRQLAAIQLQLSQAAAR